MSKKRKVKFQATIDMRDIKVRKRFAPGVRVIKSAKDKEDKHKKDYLSDIQESCE